MESPTRRSVLAGKTETTPGTAIALAAGDADNLPIGLKADPEVSLFERNVYDASLSSFQPIVGTQMETISFDLELKGSGSAGTAPKWGKYAKACGMSETVSAGVSVVYAPATPAVFDSMTIAIYRGGIRKMIAGARGSFKYAAKNGDPGMLSFTFKGLYLAVADIALPTPSGVDPTTPKPLLSALFAIHSFSACISQIAIDLNNRVNMRECANAASGFAGALIMDRNVRASLDPEEELVATMDYYGRWIAGTAGALTVSHPGAAGNNVVLAGPKAIFTKIAEQDRNGLAALGVDAALVRSSAGGNDELTITLT
jgi:hypothetical protein